MNSVYKKTDFSNAPGGNGYEWKKAAIEFAISDTGNYVIRIAASAKNAYQNGSSDDDDLRVVLNGYHFGKYEMHDEELSWKGFNTASSWNGSALKGAVKVIYFFVSLPKGEHALTFVADKKPILKEVEIMRITENEKFEVEELQPETDIQTNRKGIPWMSFVFLGVKPKKISLAAIVKSGAQKKTQDGDNIKLFLNGKILQNKKAPTSSKYKNYYFSGDQNKGKSELLTLAQNNFDFIEDSIDIWYDEKPNIFIQIELFDSIRDWLEIDTSEKIKLKFYKSFFMLLSDSLSRGNYQYSAKLLHHSLDDNPEKLTYSNEDSIVSTIKKDKGYTKIIDLIKKELKKGILSGAMILGDASRGETVNFETGDLHYSIHGLKKIEYVATKKNSSMFDLNIHLFDIYDFDPTNYDFDAVSVPVNMANLLESKGILKNFEVEIQILDTIVINHE